MSTNTKLAEALAQFEAALLFAYPAGARGAAFDCWNKARQALAAHEAEQAQRQPLTDERILAMVKAAPALETAEAEWLHVARAIERAHGIGATTGEKR